ncbi:unnamed protein product [Leptidea sinapis]|uniref:Uncharacterized protein n=1 Tax=Leptidea sinapis TaxID=189913 RepID=A0A5E4QXE7_9NEOP|nr:unnamed protein product [Leptidea sinapis]
MFESKVVIVTGASSGIGAAIAIAFAKENANVVLVGRNKERLNKVANECEVGVGKKLIIQADLTKDEDVERIVRTVVENYDKIDILVNSAGILRQTTLGDNNMMNVFDEVIRTNLRSMINLTRLTSSHLIRSKGNIVNVSSVGGSQILRSDFTLYAVSKAAINHFSRGIAIELGQHGVRVNIVSPGLTKTNLLLNAGFESLDVDLGVKAVLNKVAEPEEVAGVVLFLASNKAHSVTGSNYTVDNGCLLSR